MPTDSERVQNEADSARDPHQRLLLADRYRLDKVIGSGGMGQVWQGWDELLGRAVAVKVLHETLHDEVTTGRFALEARTAAQLNDPHVVAVYDFGTDQDRPYLVMELVDGRSLAEELESAVTPDAQRAADMAAQVAAGLASAHRHGVVHRDIKPGNLLLEDSGAVSIADFGIARFTRDSTAALGLTANGQVMGTVAYLAPERALGRPATDATDVYALGCVLYQLLTGSVPFSGDLPSATLYQHVHTEPEPPHHRDPALPPALSQYVLRLLAKDPAERPTAEQAENWLRQWVLDPAPTPRTTAPYAARYPVDTSSTPSTDARALRRPARLRSGRRRILVTGTAVAALGAATVGILALSGPAADTGKPPALPRPAAASSPPAASATTHTKSAAPSGSATTSQPPSPAQPAAATPSGAPPPPAGHTVVTRTTASDHGKSQHDKMPKKPKKAKKTKGR